MNGSVQREIFQKEEEEEEKNSARTVIGKK